MMLTPERLAELRNAGPDYYVSGDTLKLLLANIDAMRARIAELEQDAARYRSICRDVASEWGNFAGGADECLRRIEAYEQSKETP